MGRLRTSLQGRKVYLDANIFIYTLEGVEPWAKLLTDVFTGLTSGEFSFSYQQFKFVRMLGIAI